MEVFPETKRSYMLCSRYASILNEIEETMAAIKNNKSTREMEKRSYSDEIA